VPEAGSAAAGRPPAWPGVAAATLFLLATGAVLVARLLPVCALDHNVGVYVTLAELARQGVVYPREQSPDLVYCTLYQPLAFLPYAVLPGGGLSLVPSIRALVRIEVAACLGGVVVLLRRQGAAWPAALGGAVLVACTLPVSAAMLKCVDDPRGTLLAMAAVAAFFGGGSGLHPGRAAPLFVLAFLTKLTAPCAAGVAALAAAVRRRQGKAAALLLLWCAGGAAFAYGVAHLALGWDLAGNGLRYALFDAKPGRSLALQTTHFARDLVCDPVTAVVLLGGGTLALVRAWRVRPTVVDVWLLAALARAFLEYRSHGTELNHLFEPCLLGGVVVVQAVATAATGWRVAMAVAVAALVGRPALRIPCGDHTPLQESQVATAARVLQALRPAAPTLCEDPLLAWVAGQRPLLTDPFLAGQVLARHPEIRETWFAAGAAPGALARLVLIANPEREDGAADAWYGDLHFDARFLADVRRLFEVVAPSDYGVVLRRR